MTRSACRILTLVFTLSAVSVTLAGPRETVAVAVAVDRHLQTSTPALPGSGDSRSAAVPKFAGGYPTHARWWTFPGRTQADLVRHLMTGPHAGLFDETWLRALSWAELQSLHADHHTNRVDWTRVVRPQAPTARMSQPSAATAMPPAPTCPNGRCPTGITPLIWRRPR